jgi:hypothetical protein
MGIHEDTARCPNRATNVRAHNWVYLGALLASDGKPAWASETRDAGIAGTREPLDGARGRRGYATLR